MYKFRNDYISPFFNTLFQQSSTVMCIVRTWSSIFTPHELYIDSPVGYIEYTGQKFGIVCLKVERAAPI